MKRFKKKILPLLLVFSMIVGLLSHTATVNAWGGANAWATGISDLGKNDFLAFGGPSLLMSPSQSPLSHAFGRNGTLGLCIYPGAFYKQSGSNGAEGGAFSNFVYGTYPTPSNYTDSASNMTKDDLINVISIIAGSLPNDVSGTNVYKWAACQILTWECISGEYSLGPYKTNMIKVDSPAKQTVAINGMPSWVTAAGRGVGNVRDAVPSSTWSSVQPYYNTLVEEVKKGLNNYINFDNTSGTLTGNGSTVTFTDNAWGITTYGTPTYDSSKISVTVSDNKVKVTSKTNEPFTNLEIKFTKSIPNISSGNVFFSYSEGNSWPSSGSVAQPVLVPVKANKVETQVLKVTQAPQTDYGYFILNKTAPTNRSPEGAVYAIYSDSAKTNKVAEFTIQSDGKGKVKSVTGDGMTKHNDYTIKVDVTDGNKTFYYKETKLPTTTYDDFQWGALENPTTKITVSKTNTASAPAKIAAENKGTTLKFGYMYLLKIVSINGGGASTTNARTYKPTGATFDIYEGTKKVISGVTIKEVTDSAGGLYYIGKGGTITSNVGITENNDTTSNLRGWKVDITNGNRTFYARETKLPTTTYDGWKWANTVGNDTESVTVTTSNTGIGIKLEAINRIDTDTETRSVLLKKTVNVSGKLSYAQGAEYKIYIGTNSSGTYIGKFTINNSGTGVPSDVQKNFAISGNSIQWTVQKGSAAQTIYWVETKAPTNTPEGYKWSPITGHEGTKTVNSTTPSVTIQDENKLEYLAYLTVNKSVSPANNAYKPTGAVYSVFDTEVKAQAALTSRSSTGALLNFTIKEDGTSDIKSIALGTSSSKDLWVVETKLPTTTYDGFTWKWDSEVRKVTVTNNHTSSVPANVSSVNQYDIEGNVTVHKSINPVNNSFKPTGAVYSAFETKEAAENAIKSHNSNGAVFNFTIKEDGITDIYCKIRNIY